MKISTRGRYAIRILLDIAMHQENGFVAMKEIARRQQISKKYGDRGRQGGYKLIPSPGDISVLRVLNIMEGSLVPVQCLETSPSLCDRCGFCITLPMWTGLNQVMTGYLSQFTLQSLIDQAPPQPELEDRPVPD